VFGKEQKEIKGIREKEENGWDEYYVRLVFSFAKKYILLLLLLLLLLFCVTPSNLDDTQKENHNKYYSCDVSTSINVSCISICSFLHFHCLRTLVNKI